METFTRDDDYLEPEELSEQEATHIMSNLDRVLGLWDMSYIRLVTGYDWDHWNSLFETSVGFKEVFRNMTTQHYLWGSGRYGPIRNQADPEDWNEVIKFITERV